MDDETLLRRYADQGEEAAFRALAARYGGLVYGACLRIVRRPDLAEDASQGVFLILARKAGHVRVRTTLVPWLYATSSRVSRKVLRAERHHPMVSLDEAIPAPEATSDDALYQALDALSSSDREAVVLRFCQGLSLAEVGLAQGVSEDAARMRIKRALGRLRREYVPTILAPVSLSNRLSALALPHLPSRRTMIRSITAYVVLSATLLVATVGAASYRRAAPISHRDGREPLSAESPRGIRDGGETGRARGQGSSELASALLGNWNVELSVEGKEAGALRKAVVLHDAERGALMFFRTDVIPPERLMADWKIDRETGSVEIPLLESIDAKRHAFAPVAATREKGLVREYRSTDGGAAWTLRIGGEPSAYTIGAFRGEGQGKELPLLRLVLTKAPLQR